MGLTRVSATQLEHHWTTKVVKVSQSPRGQSSYVFTLATTSYKTASYKEMSD